MSRRRTLHPEEEALWQVVARSAHPMHPLAHRRKIDPVPAQNAPIAHRHPEPPPLAAFRIGEAARSATAAPRPAEPIRMDAKAFARMSRGKLAPEARLDLHGMTLAEAHPELIRFILNTAAQGLRLVLVITGKGKPGPDHGPIPRATGLLRHQVPLWLRQAPLAPSVLQVSEAHLKHGGAGALYVYLRRNR